MSCPPTGQGEPPLNVGCLYFIAAMIGFWLAVAVIAWEIYHAR